MPEPMIRAVVIDPDPRWRRPLPQRFGDRGVMWLRPQAIPRWLPDLHERGVPISCCSELQLRRTVVSCSGGFGVSTTFVVA